MSDLIWTTKEGKKIPISKMESAHLLNTVRMLKRKGWLEEEPNYPAGLSGEESQYQAEQEFFDLMARYNPLLEAMVEEANRRGLTP